jgi:hypothetical protein
MFSAELESGEFAIEVDFRTEDVMRAVSEFGGRLDGEMYAQ